MALTAREVATSIKNNGGYAWSYGVNGLEGLIGGEKVKPDVLVEGLQLHYDEYIEKVERKLSSLIKECHGTLREPGWTLNDELAAPT